MGLSATGQPPCSARSSNALRRQSERRPRLPCSRPRPLAQQLPRPDSATSLASSAPSQPPHPASYMEVLEMLEKGITPPGIRVGKRRGAGRQGLGAGWRGPGAGPPSALAGEGLSASWALAEQGWVVRTGLEQQPAD